MSTEHPIRPREHRVLVRPMQGPEKVGTLYVPDSAQEEKSRSMRGVVVAVGPGSEDEPIEVHVGDEVVHNKFAGHMIEWEDESLIIMDHTEILGVVNKE